MLNDVKNSRKRNGGGPTSTAVSGPEYFGYANLDVAQLIEGLEGSLKCIGYKKRNNDIDIFLELNGIKRFH